MVLDSVDGAGRKRGRSLRHPGVGLPEAVAFARAVHSKGLEGLDAERLAQALGYKNLRTNTFSARLSAARQFGLLQTFRRGFVVSANGEAILFPRDPASAAEALRTALREPPLYASLLARYSGRRLPAQETLADLLQHDDGITASAKEAAAKAFVDSARHAGVLGDDGVLRDASPAPVDSTGNAAMKTAKPKRSSGVRLDLKLWGPDEGKMIRVRAPESITRGSLERLIEALRLMVRIEGD